jgi:hypothetical protein
MPLKVFPSLPIAGPTSPLAIPTQKQLPTSFISHISLQLLKFFEHFCSFFDFSCQLADINAISLGTADTAPVNGYKY